jgi:DNA-binding FadR family transcriptional regulator
MDTFDSNRNLTHQVVHKLGGAIVQGTYQINAVFPTEAELCVQYDISRSVIREAVKMLAAKGLIASRPRQGIRVQPNTQWNMFDADVLQWTLASRPSLQLLREFTQLRIGIEPEAAILAARLHNPEDIRNIELALMRMREAEKGNDDSLEADIAFHTSILLASDNRFFIQLRNFIQTALRVSIASTNQLKGVKIASYRDHKKVYDAIAAGEPQQAHDAMCNLLTEALTLIDSSMLEENAVVS